MRRRIVVQIGFHLHDPPRQQTAALAPHQQLPQKLPCHPPRIAIVEIPCQARQRPHLECCSGFRPHPCLRSAHACELSCSLENQPLIPRRLVTRSRSRYSSSGIAYLRLTPVSSLNLPTSILGDFVL